MYICEQLRYIWLSSYWSQEGGGLEEQAWECPTGMWAYSNSGRVRLESPQTDLSVMVHCDNTNVLLTARAHEAAGTRMTRKPAH